MMFAGYSDDIAKCVDCSQQVFCHGNFAAVLRWGWSNEEL